MRVLAATVLFAGCSTEHFHVPDVAQIVNDALPAALQPGATTPMARIVPGADTTATLDMLAEKYIRNMFQDSYGAESGTMVSGYLNAQISVVHSRLTELANLGGRGTCTSNAPVSFTADLSTAIDHAMTITLPDLQCSVVFYQGDTNMTPLDGAGAVFGGDGNGNYSLWVSMSALPVGGTAFAATGGVATYANVQNEGSTDVAAPETVEGMVAVYFPQNTFGSALRFKANATATKFEMFYASNGGSIKGLGTGDGDVWLGGGFRMISDQSLIYADGVIYNFDNPAALWQPFTACINASTLLTDPTPSDCDALAASFTLGPNPSLSYCEIVGAGSGCTIPVPMFVNAPMAPTVVSAIAAIFPISTAPPGVTSY